MALSNTATPIYFGQFRDAVLRGEIPVCEEIWLEMQRIEALIANPDYWYDDQAVEGFIKFCEKELTLTDGSDLHMLPSFKLWAEQVLGWYYYIERDVYVPGEEGQEGHYVRRVVKKRLTKKQYLIVARGAAKSMYAEFFQAFFLVVITSTTHQVTTSPTMKQSEEVLSPFRTAIVRAKGPLFRFLTEGTVRNTTGPEAMRQKLVSTKKGIENFLTGSLLEVRPMTINKLQGLRPRLTTIDEWLSGDIREDVIGAIEQGASKMDDYLIIAISSEGTVRNGAGDTVKMELARILHGEYDAPHISIFHYKLDSVEEVANPAMWVKAQPNIGLTVSYEAYHLDVERAENAPASRNDILAKRFGIPMEGFTYFFTYEETLPHLRVPNFRSMPCALGADLSQGDDFCAFTFLFPLLSHPPVQITMEKGEIILAQPFGIVTRSYITTLTLYKLPLAMRQKYDEFIAEGSLQVLEGTVLDIEGQIYDDIEAVIIENDWDVRAFGFDPYGAREFVSRWEAENPPYGIEKVIQGARTESIPLGELKKLAEHRLLLFNQDLMTFAMGNAVTLEDTNGNRKLLKKRAQDKIDNVSALMDAYVAFKANKDLFE